MFSGKYKFGMTDRCYLFFQGYHKINSRVLYNADTSPPLNLLKNLRLFVVKLDLLKFHHPKLTLIGCIIRPNNSSSYSHTLFLDRHLAKFYLMFLSEPAFTLQYKRNGFKNKIKLKIS